MSKKILQANNAIDLVHSLVPKKDHLYQDRAFCWFFPLCPLGFLCSRQTGWVGEVEHKVAGLEQTVCFPLFVIMHALLCCFLFFSFPFYFFLNQDFPLLLHRGSVLFTRPVLDVGILCLCEQSHWAFSRITASQSFLPSCRTGIKHEKPTCRLLSPPGTAKRVIDTH